MPITDRIHSLISRPQAPANPPGKCLLLQVDGLSHTDFQKAVDEGLMPRMKARMDAGQLIGGSYACTIPSQTVVSQSGVFFGQTLPANQWYDKRDWSYHNPMGLASPDEVERDLKARSSDPIMAGGRTYMSPLAGGADPKQTFFAVSTLAAAKHAGGTPKLLREALREFSHVMVCLAAHPGQVVHSAKNWADQTASEYQVAKAQHPDDGVRKNFTRSAHDNFVSGVLADACTRSMVRDMKNGVPRLYIDFEDYDNRNHQFADPAFSRAGLTNTDRNLDILMKAAEKNGYPYVVYADHGCCPGTFYKDLTGQSFDQFLTSCLPPQIPKSLSGPDGKPLPAFLQQDIGSGTGIYFTSNQDAMSRNQINQQYPGVIDKVKANPYVAFVMTRDGADTVMESPTGTVRVSDGKVQVTGQNPLTQFGEGDAMALRLADMAHRPHQSDLMVIGKALGNDQTVNFGVLPGLHGGIGGNQQAPMIAYPAGLAIDPSKMQDSRDLHKQILALEH